MKVVLINPNICMQKGDLFGTGIPYMPISLAFVAASLRKQGHVPVVIDAFGEAPFKARMKEHLMVQGLSPEEIVARIPSDADVVCVYAAKVVADIVTKDIVAAARKAIKVPIVMIENTQSVVAYSLRLAGEAFLDLGADYVLIGEPEQRLQRLLACIAARRQPDFDGIMFKRNGKLFTVDKKEFILDLDSLPFPAWELFPLKNYWKLGYAHGPMQGNYLPLLTSRGCPFNCGFCIIPEMNHRRWRARSAKNVVDEMEHWIRTLGVREFHFEDLNPTVRKERIVEMCNEIIRRGLRVSWKLVAGTKIETFDKATADAMAAAGCIYVSISPESGSPHVMQLMQKPFDHAYGLEMIRHLHSRRITTQACFVLGYPGETDADLALTRSYMRKLVKAGCDEVSMFIMTPIPGSRQFGNVTGFSNLSQLTFSPCWRQDYKKLNRFRTRSYLEFYLLKLFYHPITLARQPFNVLLRDFRTKTEMTAFRTLRLWSIGRHAKR